VVQTTVDLEDDAPGEDEVDPAHPVDPDLALEEDPETVKSQPQDRLQPALGVRPRDVDQPAEPRGQRRTDLAPRSRVEAVQVPGRLEGGEERFRAQTRCHLDQGPLQRDDPER